ncbi:WD repeat and FYVE domain-containing protein 3 [Dirofilaria immitis]|nr:WD repeat and FYVE domain-containing protein 3 [Dirofilaria immitis]
MKPALTVELGNDSLWPLRGGMQLFNGERFRCLPNEKMMNKPPIVNDGAKKLGEKLTNVLHHATTVQSYLDKSPDQMKENGGMEDVDRSLTLLHLRKTFSEYCKVPLNGSKDGDRKFDRVLPLFGRVMMMYPSPEEIVDKFKELCPFTGHLCRHLVQEIRLRAANECTQLAASAILNFILPDVAECRGWMLLNAVLKKLCEFNCVGEELTRKDDLYLLFVGSSSSCPAGNIEWREVVSQLLVNIDDEVNIPRRKITIKLHFSRIIDSIITFVAEVFAFLNLASQRIIGKKKVSAETYFAAKNCISIFLSNVCKEDESLLDQERIGMFICLLSVLKDSAATVNVLLQDFARANGYLLLRDFILKYSEHKNILLLIMSMATCGVAELKPNYTPGLIILPTFNLPSPSNNGLTLRNIDAFHLLFQIFIQCKNGRICEAIVDAVHNIYASDAVNYFIADKECPLSQMIERMGPKSSEIQSAFRILSANPLLKDVFREVGLVESLTWTVLHFVSTDKIRPVSESEGRVALLSTDILSLLLNNNFANVCVFRENAGSNAIIDLICTSNDEWRTSALQLMKQLLISGQSEEQLRALLLILHTPTLNNISLKAVLLKSLLCALRESHKVRLMFRRSGGYLCLMSLLISLEGKLSSNGEETIPEVLLAEIISLLKFAEIIFKVLAISMRYEPSNSKYFSHEVTWDNLSLALRVSGAFTKDIGKIDANHAIWQVEPSEIQSKVEACHKVFGSNELFNNSHMPLDKIPTSVFIALSMVRFLISLALDSYEKPEAMWPLTSGPIVGDQCASLSSWTPGVVVHPGALISVLHLLPAIQSSLSEWSAAAQYYCAILIKALLRPERNQQIMCQSNMAHSILKIGVNVFKSEKHLLLAPFYYILERLSSHAITPSDLRFFLRLDMPLCCRNLDETEGEEPVKVDDGGSIPIARVKALVSMMTPRDHRIAQNPSFVEFDMAPEGFACLIIPSLAPLSTDYGIGHGERIFPPLNGLTIMMWLCIEQFSDKRVDPHPIRLLTIYRSFNSSKTEDGLKQNPSLVCFSMQLSSIDHSLLICTAESETAGNDLEKERNVVDENLIRIALGDSICVGQWTHIAVVLTRSVLKHSQAAIYINGRLEGAYKLHYIIQNVGGGAAHLSYANGIHAIIGTPPAYRSPSRLCFKIATFVLVEEPVAAEAVIRIYDLEPHYIGNFQERICLSLSAVASKEMSASRIGSMYSKADSAFIARYAGVSIHDRSTPLRVLLNTVTHAPGAARSFGAVLLGYLGMRLFTPCPVTRLLDCVGGISCLFGLVAMATTSQELYASLKALTTAVKTDKITSRHLINTRSYQILAMLLEGKTELLNSHILHLILSLVGTLDTSKDTSVIPNLSVFEDMLCDLDVWKDASPDLNRLLYEHFYELITDHNSENLNMVRRSSLPSRLLIRLFDHPSLIFAVNDIVFNLITALLQPPADNLLLLKVGQLVAGTLPIPGSDQNESSYAFSITDLQTALFANKHSSHFDRLLYDIYVRNRILSIIANTLAHSSVNNNLLLCDLVAKTLGFDWILALITPGAHYTTVVLGLRILLALLKHSHLMQKFKEGSANGGWLTDADSFVRNRAAVLLGFSVSAYGGNVGAHVDINPELSECGGFIILEHLLYYHSEKPQCYLAMLALLVGQPVSGITLAVSGIEICCEAVIPLLSMVRAAVHASVQEFITYLFCALVPLDIMGSSTTKDENSASSPFCDVHTVLEGTCCRSVLDLIKRILYEDIYRNHGTKADSLLDALIENIPEYGCSRRFCISVLSENLSLCMEYMIATDVLLESEKQVPPQLAEFRLRLLLFCLQILLILLPGLLTAFGMFDEVIGIYVGEASRVLSFLFKGLALTRRNDPKSVSYDSLMQSLDRTILYLLSRPIDNVNVQMSILNTLSEIILHRSVVLSPSHNDPLFFGSLTHLLFMLSVTPDILPKRNDHRILIVEVLSEKNLLKEVFRSGFVADLNAARALLSHAASLQWLSFVDSQINSSAPKSAMQFQRQIQSRITKVATGLQRLATRKALSSSGSVCSFTFSRQPNITTEVVQMWLRVHISLIKELVRTQCLCYHEWHSHVQKWCMQDWRSSEMELIRERGIWGAELGSSLDKYMLDMTEGPCRIRRKLIPNPTFYHHYPYRPHLDYPEAKAIRAKVAVSKDSKLYYAAVKRRRGKISEQRIIDFSVTVYTPSEERSDLLFTDMQEISTSMIRRVSIKHALRKNSEETECIVNEKDVNEADEENVEENENEEMIMKAKDGNIARKRGPDNQTLLRLLEQGEQLHSMFRCARVQGLDTSEGLLHDPIVPYMACGINHPVRRTRLCSKFSYNDIREVHRRRYLLQPIAIEVFSADGRNYLLAFPRRMRNRVYQKFLSLARLLKDNGSESVGGQRSTAPVEQTSRVSLLTSLIGQQSVTHRWVRGEISNFQYLMHLNTLAGRSYNDLSQYPIFPWILRDYESEDLNLTDPRFFRDLSKPMGAQNQERLEQFLKRYREWDDPTGETPAYMYGTHYSSAMIVVSYLGGHFDLADRMFHSVGDAWLSASRNNMADNGVALDDVILPAWSKGDARNLCALECDYVSANLHNWIDLIFGYKQRGDAAIEANNVYHHLFYEGNVDFDNIEDPLTRYLFINSRRYNTATFYHSFDSLKVPAQPIKELKSMVGSLIPLEKGGVLALEANRALLLPNRFISWGFLIESTCIYELCESAEITCCACGDSRTIFTGSSTGKICVWDLTERHPRIRFRRTLTAHTEAITAIVVCSAQTLLVSGSRDGSAIVWHLSALTFIRQLRPHSSAVTAIAINDTTGDIVTASGSTLFLWSINGRLLSVVDSVDIASFQTPNVILSLAFSTLYEWDPENVIMCGGSDGIVRIYSMEFVRSEDDLNLRASRLPAVTTLQERVEQQRQRLQLLSIATISSDTPLLEVRLAHQSHFPVVLLIYTTSMESWIKWQESETAHSKKLIWKKLLVPKFSLTTHTAFNRKDNPYPASITAIAPSRDHRTLFVGDSVGRVWSWQIGDEVGARADHWVQDPSRNSCTQCMQKFSLAERRHHCRNCGHIFAIGLCSRFETDIKHMKISKPVRVCQICFMRLKAEGMP